MQEISWVTRAEVNGRACVKNEEVVMSEDVKKGFARKEGMPAAPCKMVTVEVSSHENEIAQETQWTRLLKWKGAKGLEK